MGPAKASAVSIVCLVFVLASAGTAWADGFLVPYIGFNFGGNSNCPSLTNCEDKRMNFGVAFGTLGRGFGFETDFGYAKNFFGDIPGTDNSVFTWMNNVLIGGGGGRIQPYLLSGIGIINPHVSVNPVESIAQSFTKHSMGWDVGVGVLGFFGRGVGIRGDIRRLQTFDDFPLLGNVSGQEKLNYWRGTIGLALQF